MSQPIIFYDLNRKLSDGESESERCWSPNTMKTRIPLNIKGLPYTIVWLNFVDIKPTLSGLGITPNLPAENQNEFTVPAIHDPNTGRKIMDSQKILAYLEEQYPDTPTLFPPHTRALQTALIESVIPRLFDAVPGTMVMDVLERLVDVDQPFFRSKREAAAGTKVENMMLKGEARVEKLAAFEKVLRDIARWLDASSGPYFTDNVPSNADVHVTGMLLCVLRMGGKEHDAVKKVMEASNGRVAKYLKEMEQFVGDSKVNN